MLSLFLAFVGLALSLGIRTGIMFGLWWLAVWAELLVAPPTAAGSFVIALALEIFVPLFGEEDKN
ncbi:MAG: hypothetical protein CMA72_09810 [Euryarchaeota archaeon]|nr:hypothetical protein [Euryarchaeota archaeon]|tara:strand:- start:711 stop:905 length:195 start_codon:yes stop_codon:yes gene_type:complete